MSRRGGPSLHSVIMKEVRDASRMKPRPVRCPKCHVGGYTRGTATDGRPQFKCTRCDYVWTAGKSGKPYI
jgi:transposase-like protein